MDFSNTFTLAAGSVCKRNGLPFKLLHATQIECHPGLWPLIKGEPPEFAQEEVVRAPRPLAPCGAAELIPILTRLVELLETRSVPSSVTYSFADADEATVVQEKAATATAGLKQEVSYA